MSFLQLHRGIFLEDEQEEDGMGNIYILNTDDRSHVSTRDEDEVSGYAEGYQSGGNKVIGILLEGDGRVVFLVSCWGSCWNVV